MVSCGFEHCIGMLESGRVFTWGFGGSGCLGHNTYESLEEPKQLNFND